MTSNKKIEGTTELCTQDTDDKHPTKEVDLVSNCFWHL